MTPSVALSNTFAKNADIGRRERGDVKDSTETNKTNRRNRQDTRQTRHTHTGEDGCNDLNPNPSGDQIKMGAINSYPPPPGYREYAPPRQYLVLDNTSLIIYRIYFNHYHYYYYYYFIFILFFLTCKIGPYLYQYYQQLPHFFHSSI